MKKRIMAAVLAAAMTLSLGACSGSGQTQGAGSSQAEDAGGRQAGGYRKQPGRGYRQPPVRTGEYDL